MIYADAPMLNGYGNAGIKTLMKDRQRIRMWNEHLEWTRENLGMEYEIRVRCIFWRPPLDSEAMIEKDLEIVSKYTRQFAQVLVNGMLLYRCGCSEAGDMLKELIDKENETAQEYGKMYEQLAKSNG